MDLLVLNVSNNVYQNADLSAMYEARAPRYARFADAIIENSGTVPEAAAAIKELLL